MNRIHYDDSYDYDDYEQKVAPRRTKHYSASSRTNASPYQVRSRTGSAENQQHYD